MSDSNSYSLSYIGRRDSNQDACLVIHRGKLAFMAVADGMGGTIGGEIASETVIDVCKKHIDKLAECPLSPEGLKDTIKTIFDESRNQLKLIIDKNPELSKMGTTLSCLLLHDSCFAWGSIGDSRIYHFRKGTLQQLTADHTFVEEYRREFGDNIPEYIRQRSNVITRCLGGNDDQPDVFPTEKKYETIEPGEGFLICSDGLLPEKVDTDTSWIVDYLKGTRTLEQAAKNMVSHAYHQGSADNISLVLYEHDHIKRRKGSIRHYHYPPKKRPANSNSGLQKRGIRFLIFSIIALLLGLYGYYVVDKIKEKDITATKKINNKKVAPTQQTQHTSDVLYHNWDPANKLRGGFPIRISNDKLNWDEYPDYQSTDKYELRFKSHDSSREIVTSVKGSITQIDLDGVVDLDGAGLLPGEYTLTIYAILTDSIKVQGKEVNLTLKR